MLIFKQIFQLIVLLRQAKDLFAHSQIRDLVDSTKLCFIQ